MKGLIQIFYEPGKVFDYVREHRAWVIALIANMLLGAAFYAFATESIGAANIARHQMEDSKFSAQMTPEQREVQAQAADTPTRKVIGDVAGFVITGVFLAIFGLLFMAIAGVSGGPINFSQALGTVAYAAWPISVIRIALSIVVILMAADKSDLDIQHLLAFNAGSFLDKATTAKPLFAVASAFDLIVFAQIALAAFGLSRVAHIAFTKALFGIILIWAVFTALGAGLSLVF